MLKICILSGLFSLVSQQIYSQENADQKLEKLALNNSYTDTKNTSNYVNFVRTGNLIFLSGKGPLAVDGTYITGKVGTEVSLKSAREAARYCAVFQLAVLKKELGSLTKIKRIVKVTGYVNSAPDFSQHSQVIDGFSELLIEIFGEAGKHARTSVGVASLPNNWSVEADLIVEVSSN